MHATCKPFVFEGYCAAKSLVEKTWPAAVAANVFHFDRDNASA
jgi:hypothetical protein